jgi:hypothetical protein
MIKNYATPLKIELVNISNKVQSFIPYRENFIFPIGPNGKISFYTQTSGSALYYEKQKIANLNIKEVNTTTKVETGKYNLSTETFTVGASYNIDYIRTFGGFDDYKVYGTLPYSAETPEIGMPAGNRFTIRTINPNITKRADLPSGEICNIIITDEGGNRIQSYTKSAFEDDGSLVTIVNAKKNTILTINIKWESDADFTNYQFNFENVELGAQGEELKDIEDIEIVLPQVISLTNIGAKSVTFIPYKENFMVSILPQDTITFSVNSNEEVLYYLLQASKDLKIEL